MTTLRTLWGRKEYMKLVVVRGREAGLQERKEESHALSAGRGAY